MVKRRKGVTISPLEGLAASGAGPLYLRVYNRIRGAILDGTLSPGQRLPSTRTLAADLGLARITIESALSQLQAEGFVVRRVGAGTFVAIDVPESAKPPRRENVSRAATLQVQTTSEPKVELSARGRLIIDASLPPEPRTPGLLVPCMPALDSFPFDTWQRLLGRRIREGGSRLAGYGDAPGFRPLRREIATYVASARGVRCTWEQVVVLTGAQQGLDIVARLLLDPGDAVWMEEPGYRGATNAFRAAGAKLVPVPVDSQGIVVDVARAAAPRARMAYVTPSHQYPLGVTTSLERRRALLGWARDVDAWVLEDDYDSEFRYAGRPIAALQGLDDWGRVLYLGTFNKVLFPSLRLGYLIIPAALVPSVTAARTLADGYLPVASQAALADFVSEGHFDVHLRSMRSLYRERRDALVDAVRAELGGQISLLDTDAGMHVTGTLGNVDDVALVTLAATHKLEPRALSTHYLGSPTSGLVLGYSGTDAASIRNAVRSLARLLTPRGSTSG